MLKIILILFYSIGNKKTAWIKIQLFLSRFFLVSNHCLDLCGDWIPYKDQKCFKILPKKATQAEALQKCMEMNKDSTLVTIHDQEEQEFINQLLVSFNNISMNAWIGLIYNRNYGNYRWKDNQETSYTNWSEDAIREGSEPCVQMSLMNRTLGKWMDSNCRRRGSYCLSREADIHFEFSQVYY